MPSTDRIVLEPWYDKALFYLLVDSYRRIVGKALVPDDSDAHWLYHHAPFAVVAHNTDPDPLFIYANMSAQRCFEYDWQEFTSLPSRLSAEVPNRADRQLLLETVARDGHASGYRGARIAKSGRHFWIEDGCVWQLTEQDGLTYGQAATFSITD
ncbi:MULTISPECIES: MEKHLA domain-containing protein [unclassified Rhizobium]|uniref:MEKHLA domain-containing protein n=1 Tax=unclassified Rhizobium TaxID=2613769 RepID=UPI001ADB1D5A|nr:MULTISPECIES: MEKHLA domain-containing protein [unclassified Rhizobium]MBO9101432.1 MEKHLA domain-containing protein [Rhizobium sp. L58/93]MBO9134907.1 MEKHLA domain-containing protein [Rhizobium sp. B209b/85]MBO9171142.1 MEKHLA domain-containing protein [Rhizobium sp. L245/93]MBO9187423.1 MEKHLA domain-containing protein [Rhizobium sp. E27B/91]QXZ86785.1 MEKHLA domain-containing protein [Rhizobium sp. K1/93]